MTFPQAHQYVTVIGDSYGTLERWQFGFRLTSGGVSNQATADAIKPYVLKWWVGTAAPYSVNSNFGSVSTHRLTEIKCANIETTGLYPPTLPSASSFVNPITAGTNAPHAGMLPQGSLAMTLTTAVPRGLASKGRVYLPPSLRYQPFTDGLLPVAETQKLADSFLNLIKEINADPLVGNVAIFSRGKGVAAFDAVKKKVRYSYPGAGAVNNVTGVRVGRVVDTQRRRRRSLAELPVTAVGTV